MMKKLGAMVGAAAMTLCAAAEWTPFNAMFAGGPGDDWAATFPATPDCPVAGLAVCGMGEYKSVYGIELGAFQYAQTMYGLQVGFYSGMTSGFALQTSFINYTDAGGGLQVGLANIADGAGATMQVGIYNGPSSLTHGGGGASGLQIGLVNNSFRGRHVQIGLYNVAEHAEFCLQIGLFCKRDDDGFLLLGWHW